MTEKQVQNSLPVSTGRSGLDVILGGGDPRNRVHSRQQRPVFEGTSVGRPLAEFQGVLTGVPTFTGASDSMAGAHDVKS